MNIEQFIRDNYAAACRKQNKLKDGDQAMVAIVHDDTNLGADAVSKWMSGYGLQRGISKDVRKRIVGAYVNFVRAQRPLDSRIGNDELLEKYGRLYRMFAGVKDRNWTSATSKLLWCMYPKRGVIYDAFVWRALVVLQIVDPALATGQKLGSRPEGKGAAAHEEAIAHYKRYQVMVRKIEARYRDLSFPLFFVFQGCGLMPPDCAQAES